MAIVETDGSSVIPPTRTVYYEEPTDRYALAGGARFFRVT